MKAIARGFSPLRAYKLLNEDNYLEIIDLSDHLSTPKAVKRIKGRVIGKGGKTRKLIEERTGALISVYGKTIAIIGDGISLSIAKKAIGMLIKGANHSTVYTYLEQNRPR